MFESEYWRSKWEEVKHPRGPDGKFDDKGGGGGGKGGGLGLSPGEDSMLSDILNGVQDNPLYEEDVKMAASIQDKLSKGQPLNDKEHGFLSDEIEKIKDNPLHDDEPGTAGGLGGKLSGSRKPELTKAQQKKLDKLNENIDGYEKLAKEHKARADKARKEGKEDEAEGWDRAAKEVETSRERFKAQAAKIKGEKYTPKKIAPTAKQAEENKPKPKGGGVEINDAQAKRLGFFINDDRGNPAAAKAAKNLKAGKLDKEDVAYLNDRLQDAVNSSWSDPAFPKSSLTALAKSVKKAHESSRSAGQSLSDEERAGWDEKSHPRGPNGKFAGVGPSGPDEPKHSGGGDKLKPDSFSPGGDKPKHEGPGGDSMVEVRPSGPAKPSGDNAKVEEHLDTAAKAMKDGNHVKAVNALTAAMGQAKDKQLKAKIKQQRDVLAKKLMGRDSGIDGEDRAKYGEGPGGSQKGPSLKALKAQLVKAKEDGDQDMIDALEEKIAKFSRADLSTAQAVARHLPVVRSASFAPTLLAAGMDPEETAQTVAGGGTFIRASYRADRMTEDSPVMTLRFSVFNNWYEINSAREGRFLERVAPGAFTKTIEERGGQVKVLFNHGKGAMVGEQVLGKVLKLEERADGAHAEVELLDTSYNRDLIPGLRAGVYGSSFMFNVMDDQWDDIPKRSASNPDALPERTVTALRLMEFGPVTWPANPAATAGLRSNTDTYCDAVRAENPDGYRALIEQFEEFRSAVPLVGGVGPGLDELPDEDISTSERSADDPDGDVTENDEAASRTNAPDSSERDHAEGQPTNSPETRRARLEFAGVI